MRLIDADALNKKKKYLFQTKCGVFPKSEWFIKADDLFSAKTIDAVEVVRCKDCVHWFGECDDGQEHSCDMDALLRSANHFCAHGERK